MSKATKPIVVFVINEYSFFLSHRKNLIHTLSQWFDITVLTDLSGEQDWQHDSTAYKLVHHKKRQGTLSSIKFFWTLVMKINKVRPHFIFFVSLENCVFGSLAQMFLTYKKIFLLVTGTENFLRQNSIRQKLIFQLFAIFLKLSINKSKLTYIFQNNDDPIELSEALNISIKNFQIIYGNGIDMEQFSFQQRFQDNPLKKKINILFASRLLKTKGVMIFYHAAQSLAKLNKFNFYMVGQYNPSHHLSISSKDWMLIQHSKNIIYQGHVSPVYIQEKFLENDIFVLPSSREGLPSSALEAASTGMPLLLSNATGCKECIAQGSFKNGILFDLQSNNSLEQSILELCKDQESLAAYSKNSRAFVEKNFSLHKIAEEYRQLLYRA